MITRLAKVAPGSWSRALLHPGRASTTPPTSTRTTSSSATSSSMDSTFRGQQRECGARLSTHRSWHLIAFYLLDHHVGDHRQCHPALDGELSCCCVPLAPARQSEFLAAKRISNRRADAGHVDVAGRLPHRRRRVVPDVAVPYLERSGGGLPHVRSRRLRPAHPDDPAGPRRTTLANNLVILSSAKAPLLSLPFCL
jgi:hypothetical protein